MLKTTQPLYSLEQTGATMGELAIKYCEDMRPFYGFTLFEVQNYIKNLPYRDDPEDQEFISRPSICMNDETIPFDCDDRAVCIGAFCELHGIPFRFVAVCEYPNPDFHHVYTEVKIDGNWIPCDATYPEHEIGQEKENVTKRQVIFERREKTPLLDTPHLNGFFSDLGSWAYRKGGEIVDTTIDLPGNVADKVSDSASSLIDDPLGAMYRTGGRLVDNTADVGKSLGSITGDVFTLDWEGAGKDLATLNKRTTNLFPSGLSEIANTLTVASLTQDRDTMGNFTSVAIPVALSVVGVGAISGLAASGAVAAGLSAESAATVGTIASAGMTAKGTVQPLLDKVSSYSDSVDAAKEKVDYYSTISFPFANLITIIFGVSITSNRRKGGAALHFGISLIVSFLYLGFVKISQVFGYNGDVNPILTAWLANITFLGVSLFNFYRLNRY